MHRRRIPGTLALALTNVMGAGLLVDTRQFDRITVHEISRSFLPAQAWGALFAVAGICLLVAALTRRIGWLNVGSTLSLFAWTAVSLSVLTVLLAGDAALSPVAGALFVWMVAGQAAMLFTPLLGDRRGPS